MAPFVLASGCTAGLSGGGATQPAAQEITCEAKARLDALQALATRRKQTVQLELSAPFMPTSIKARGGVAMDPAQGDLRLILVGAGGGTAVDLWMHGAAYRFVVPALGRTLRGDGSTPASEKKGLPVDFLAWWMLHPLRGEVLVASVDEQGLSFVLRDVLPASGGGLVAYVDARVTPNGWFEGTRTTWANDASGSGAKVDEETISASSLGCGRVEYTQRSTSLHVVAVCEDESADVPDRAFVDPESPARQGRDDGPEGATRPKEE